MNHFILLLCLALAVSALGDKRCSKQKANGPCRAEIVRYYYDQSTNECRTFNYGGCSRYQNENNFLTKPDCIRTCVTSTRSMPPSD